MFKIDPEYFVCSVHDEVTPVNEWGESCGYDGECPKCGRPVTAYYVCPGCGKDKAEHEFTIDDFDLCKVCFKREIEAMEQEEHSKARQQIIEFLKECG